MILIQESSAGDIRLYKFIIYLIPKISGVDEQYYDETLGGYLYYFDYFYNIFTRNTNDSYVTHSDIIDSTVPFDVKKKALELGIDNICGKTDCYMKDKNGNNPIRMWFTGQYYILNNKQKQYLKRLFQADNVI